MLDATTNAVRIMTLEDLGSLVNTTAGVGKLHATTRHDAVMLFMPWPCRGSKIYKGRREASQHSKMVPAP